MKILVEFISAKRGEVDCSPTDTVSTLKERISYLPFFDCGWNRYDLVYLGKKMEDDSVLGHFIINDNPVFYFILRVSFPGG
jgi:hypothetical protein